MAIRRIDICALAAQTIGAGRRNGAAHMGVILIECPISFREFSTGILTDKASFDVIRDVTARARCPYCGQQHEWRKRDARFADTVGPDAWGESPLERRVQTP